MVWPTETVNDVHNYLKKRVIEDKTLIWPHTTEDAILFAQTEISEAVEVLFARKSYVRNHPEDKPGWSASAFGEELGDAIFMLIVAGIMIGVDPIMAMYTKMREYEDARTDKE